MLFINHRLTSLISSTISSCQSVLPASPSRLLHRRSWASMNDVYTNDYHVVLTSSHDQLQLSVCRRHLVLARSTDDRIYCYGPRRNSDEVSFSADCFCRNFSYHPANAMPVCLFSDIKSAEILRLFLSLCPGTVISATVQPIDVKVCTTADLSSPFLVAIFLGVMHQMRYQKRRDGRFLDL